MPTDPKDSLIPDAVSMIKQEMKSQHKDYVQRDYQNLSDVFGMIEVVTIVPTHTPLNMFDQFKILVDDIDNPSVRRLYVYNYKARVWDSMSSVESSDQLNTRSIRINGVNQYASIADASQTGLDLSTNFTVEAWVQFSTLPSTFGDSSIVAKWNNMDTTQQSYLMQVDSANQLQILFEDSGGNQTVASLSSGIPSLTTNVWHHYAVIANISVPSFTFMIDGAVIYNAVTNSAATSIKNSTTPVTVGARNSGSVGVNFLHGFIDAPRIWNLARSTAEIATNYQTYVSSTSSGLVSEWRFDSDLLDFTSNNNDLTNNGSFTFSTDVPF